MKNECINWWAKKRILLCATAESWMEIK